MTVPIAFVLQYHKAETACLLKVLSWQAISHQV
jgi:hypothetical protein